MEPGALLAYVEVVADLIHAADGPRRTERLALPGQLLLADFAAKHWGGPIGATPRDHPERAQIEGAILQYVDVMQALNRLRRA